MVVLVIIVIITSVVLTSQGSFNKSLVLANTAYDIALTIRSTETFGLSTRAAGTTVNTGYGLHFEVGVLNSFKLFADTNPPASCTTPNCNSGNYAYEDPNKVNPHDTNVQTYLLGNSISILKFCALSSGSWLCSPSITSLDIVFQRPNPNAYMSKNGAYNVLSPVTQACIVLSSPQGGVRYISVQNTGQIIANATSALCGNQ